MPFDADLRAAADDLWEAQHNHPFVRGLGDGTLPAERFREYIAQDYVFLIDYGRLLALGAAKAPDLPTMRKFAELTQAILVTEMDLHRSLAAGWGVDEETLAATVPSPATAAYVDFLLRTAALGDFAELVAVLLPCMWSYAEIGERLDDAAAAGAADPGPYRAWVETYASDEFGELADWCRRLTAELGADAREAGRARMTQAFLGASRHELAFWEACWRPRTGSERAQTS